VRGRAERLVGIEERGGALAKLGVVEAEDAIGARGPSHHRGLDEALKIDREIVAFRAQGTPAFEKARNGIAAQQHYPVDERAVFEQRRPFRLDHPGEARAGITVLEGGHGGQGVNDVAHGAEPHNQDAAAS